MKILALEFSTDRRSAAIVESGRVLGSAAETAPGATHAFELIGRALDQAHLVRGQIECLALGLGPGSYTGIRAAIAVAQGWQLAREIKLIGVRSVDCLAEGARAQGWFGRVNIVIDAQRNEVYLAGYDVSAEKITAIEALRIVPVDEARTRERAGELMIGPEAQRWFSGGRTLFPDAEILGRMACGLENFVAGEKLEPVYLRETSFVKAAPVRKIERP